jgi:hypothetical protein
MEIIIVAISSILQLIGLVLFKFYGWVVLAAILAYSWWQNRRKISWVEEHETILLLVEVPKDNEKKELSAEQLFASLHGILRPKSELLKEGSLQEHISFEIASIGNTIQFYVWCPKHLKDFVEGQIYAQYPTVHIKEGAEDYTRHELGDRIINGAEVVLTKPEALPIRTFQSFEVDPLAGITAVLAKLGEVGEEMWIQVLARPVDDNWQDSGKKFINDIKAGKQPGWGKSILEIALQIPLHIMANFFNALVAPPEAKKEDKKDDKLSTGQQTMIKAIEEKISKLGYEVKIRVVYIGPDQTLAKQRMQAIVGGFKQFNTTNLNGFRVGSIHTDDDFIDDYRARLFLDHGYTLNIEELASLYHLPHKSVETPNMVWTSTKTAEPPANLPIEQSMQNDDISLFGLTNYRGTQLKFGIRRRDRGRHLYVVGQTGTGKSMLLQLLALSDIYHNHGIAIVDPHGDFATDIMKYIPEHRIKDVIYINPADLNYPIAFNPLEVADPNFKNHISSEVVGVLRRLFESWGPRLEHILRFTLLALLDSPDSTMLDITRMLTEKEFRKKIVKQIKDPVVRNFWVNEFASWNDKFATEAVAPVLNKVGAFTANPLVRNIIGQPKSAFDLRQVMDNGKILIVNLSRGMVGEDNAAILGALIVTKIQLAAMSRANVPMESRRPFYLYVDEFQNFATDSFAVILSEARKYGLNLTVANQYIAQMPETVRDAVFGNVGSMITFRVSATDGSYLGKYFEPVFEAGDLVKLNNQHIFISMSIDGEKALPFSAKTLKMPEPEQDLSAEIVEYSRKHYASLRQEVEELIARRSQDEEQLESPGFTPRIADNRSGILGQLKNPEGGQRPRLEARTHSQSRPPQRYDNSRPPERHDRQQPRQDQAPPSSKPQQSAHDERRLEPGQAVDLRR